MDGRHMYFPTKNPLFRQNTHSSAYSSGKKDLAADHPGRTAQGPNSQVSAKLSNLPKYFHI